MVGTRKNGVSNIIWERRSDVLTKINGNITQRGGEHVPLTRHWVFHLRFT